MASIFIGVNRGVVDKGPDALTEGAATGGTDVELRFDTSKGLTRLEIIQAMEAIERYLEDGRVATYTL